MENNFIVYQTINIINNKIYIGVHKTKDINIFDGYIGNGVNINFPSTYMNPKYPFQKAVKKYGTANFKRSILYVYDNEEDAYIKERELVNLNFVQREDTYNLILGGSVRPLFYNRNKIYQFNIDGTLVKEWKDIYEVSEFLETWKQSIYSAIENKNRLYNYYWSYYSEINISEYSNPNNSQQVYKYSKNGKCLAIYDSITKAAKENNYSTAELYNRIKERALTKNNYYSLELMDEYIPKPRLQLKNKIKNSDIFEFNKVCKELNLDNSTVNKVLRGVNKSTKGYILKIKDIV